jgi:hypothetical protein
MRAICTLSLAATLVGFGFAASTDTLIPAPATAVVKKSRLEVTLYFLSDEEEEVVVLGVEDDELELSDEEPELLLPLLLDEESEDLAASFLSDFSEELSPSFLEPPLPGLLLPLLA